MKSLFNLAYNVTCLEESIAFYKDFEGVFKS